MVRFIRYWIERNMEDPQLREENARKHLEMVSPTFPLLLQSPDVEQKEN